MSFFQNVVFVGLKDVQEIFWYVINVVNHCARSVGKSVHEQLIWLVSGHCIDTVRWLIKDKQLTNAIDAMIAYGECKITRNAMLDIYNIAYSCTIDSDYKGSRPAALLSTSIGTWAVLLAAKAAGSVCTSKADYFAVYNKNQYQTADICRKYLTEAILEKANFS